MSNSVICGIDEVGRGALAGPIMAVAASFEGVFPSLLLADCPIEGVNDSKKLSPKKRLKAFHNILRHPSLKDFGIGEASVEEINIHGINHANDLAFYRALQDLGHKPAFTIVDGVNEVKWWEGEQACTPKADAVYWPVSAASILAKVIRDGYMSELAADYPSYRWNSNSGYGSGEHVKALKDHGACSLHRKQFVEGLL